MKIGKITSSAEYRMGVQLKHCQFLEPSFGFPNWKNSRNFLISQCEQFQKFSIWKVIKKFNLENCKNFPHFTISEIIEFQKFYNLEN